MTTKNAQEPEPLAVQVRPQPEESFDSWLGRLSGAHDVRPLELFDYLRIDKRLASIDLARGRPAPPTPLWRAFDDMVRRLAWAVAIDASRIRAMFVKGGESSLLPPGLRRFVCPACALERCRVGQPIIVKREWTLRLAWRCHDHRLPLVDLARASRFGVPLRGWLERASEAMTAFEAEQDYDGEMIARNRQVLKHLLGPTPGQLSRVNGDYLARFARDSWHLASSRTLLLASGHDRNSVLAARYQRFEHQLEVLRKYDEARQPTVPVTLERIGATIGRIHADLTARGSGRLAVMHKRLQARSVALRRAQAKLDATYACFRAAWDRQNRVRALRERCQVLTADREIMLGRIMLECCEGRSTSASLLYLRKALAYRRRALARNRNGFPHPIVRPEAWGLGMPNNSRLLGMIGDLEQAKAAAEKGNPSNLPAGGP